MEAAPPPCHTAMARPHGELSFVKKKGIMAHWVRG